MKDFDMMAFALIVLVSAVASMCVVDALARRDVAIEAIKAGLTQNSSGQWVR